MSNIANISAHGLAYVNHDRGHRAYPPRSHPRHAPLTLLFDRLRAIVGSDALQRGETLLDYGCGNKPYESLFRQKFNAVIGADFPGNSDAEIMVGPRGDLPISESSVDCVLSTQVLEHVESPDFYLAEAYRVLRPCGSLVLSTHGTWRYHADPVDYWRWTIEGLRLQIRRAGFDIWQIYSVLGMASCALQLWQDATADRLPKPMRHLYIWTIQGMIKWIERYGVTRLSLDASLYVVLAHKRTRRDIAPSDEYDHRIELATRELNACIPAGEPLILVDQAEIGAGILSGRDGATLIERRGEYWGPPADDHEALLELDRMHCTGRNYVVFGWPAFWWLEHYARLHNYLHTTAQCVLDNERLVVFALPPKLRTLTPTRRIATGQNGFIGMLPTFWRERLLPRFCPLCQGRFRRFDAFGDPPRDEAQCPGCGSLERHRLIWQYFRERTDLLDGRRKRMLHVAPEECLAQQLSRQEGIDYLSGDLDPAKAMIPLDLMQIPFADNSFDVIYCSHVLEHVPDDRRAMRELFRVLKPGGWAILQVPIADLGKTDEDPGVTDPQERRRRFGQEDHVRRYGRDYVRRLESVEFQVHIDTFAREVGESAIRAMGLPRHENVYLCRKMVEASKVTSQD